MSVSDIRKKISTVELALKEAGPDQALNAVVDALKEVARTVEALEQPSSGAGSTKPTDIPMVAQPEGRKFRHE
jgi:hypothetical protein